ncbi:MAG: sigma-70 family RNA polymerase sigma factor [Ruminococcaceae bacterium]|nr:sigma-70 family RNA polymerase sigma factor [Oscillospiraceae bacterium]
MSKHIIYINGTAIEVSEEIYTYISRSDWNTEYAEIKRKREKITMDCETQTVKITSSKEDSLDRLMALGIEFPDQSEPLEDAIIRKITLEQALAQLTADERFIICELYFADKTERELAKELCVSQVNIHKKKCKILYKLYEILK